MSEFKIRRGQVFYISKDAQSGPQPYIVLSNNKCNETSDAVHAAPIRTGPADVNKYYQCPFTGTCNRSMFVDAAKTTLISKERLTEANYSAPMSYYTVNNSYLITRIEEALCQQLGITKNYVVYGDTEPTEKKQEPIQVTINMNITGMDSTSPVTVTAEPVITAVQKKEPDVFIEPKMVQESIDKTLEASKIVSVTETSNPELAVVINGRTKRRTAVWVKPNTDHRTIFTREEQRNIIETIMTKSKAFGGYLSGAQIAKELGISPVTVQRYTRELLDNKNQGSKVRRKVQTATPKRVTPPSDANKRHVYMLVKSDYKDIPATTLEKAVSLYNEGGYKAVMENLPNTFKSAHCLRNFLFRNCAKVEGDK